MLKIFCSFLLVLPFTGLAQMKAFTIKGQVGTLQAPAKVYLKYIKENKNHTDSCVLKNGSFTLRGSVNEPGHASLFLSRDGEGIRWPYDELMFFIDAGTTTIRSKDSMQNAIAGGTRVNEDLNRYNAALKNSNNEMIAIATMKETMDPALREIAGFRHKVDSLKAIAITNGSKARKQFVRDNPSSFISLTALYELSYFAESSTDFQSVQALFNLLSPNLKQNKAGKKLSAELDKMKNLVIGMPAPEFTQPDTSGRAVSLSHFRGSYVLVDFWSSWCKPCRAESKDMVIVYETFKDKNFTIVGVSIDQYRDKWLRAVYEDRLPWMQLSDLKKLNGAADLYQVRSIPSNYLIAPNGDIVAKNLHGEALREKLKEVLRGG